MTNQRKIYLILFLVIALAGTIAFGSMGTRYLSRHEIYVEGMDTYAQTDCEVAITIFDSIIDGAEFYDVDSLSSQAQGKKDECLLYLEGVEAQEEEAYGLAIVTYTELLLKYTDSLLDVSIHNQVEDIYRQDGLYAIVDTLVCDNVDSVVQAGLIFSEGGDPEDDEAYFYFMCGTHYEISDMPESALHPYRVILTNYTDHPFSVDAQAALLQIPNSCNETQSFQMNATIAGLPDFMPFLYWVCGQSNQDMTEFGRAIEYYNEISAHYPEHYLASEVEIAVENAKAESIALQESLERAIKNRRSSILLSIGISLIPGIGDAKDVFEVAIGEDLITGDPLADWEKGVTIAGLALSGAGWLRYSDESAALLKNLDELEDLTQLKYLDDYDDLVRYGDDLSGVMSKVDLERLASHSDALAAFVVRRSNQVTNLAPYCDEIASILAKSDDVPISAIDLAKLGACSFSPDTVVRTSDGVRSIDSIHRGDFVWAYDEDTGRNDYFPVTAVWSHEDPIMIQLTIDGEIIKTTQEHPFYTDEGWLPAGNLIVDQQIQNADFSWGTLESVEAIYVPQEMYNLKVAGAHTFYVGEEGWLVHNECPYNIISKVLDNANIINVPDKHLFGAGGNWSKFSENVDAESLVIEALGIAKRGNGNAVMILPYASDSKYEVIVDLGRVIGTKGQERIMIVIGYNEPIKLITAFPVK